MSNAVKTTIKKFSFTKWISEIEGSGARVLGFCEMTVCVDGLEFTFSDLKVRVNQKGEHHLCAPSRRYKNSEGAWRTSSAYKFDNSTYAALRSFVYGRDEVKVAIDEAADLEKEIPLSA